MKMTILILIVYDNHRQNEEDAAQFYSKSQRRPLIRLRPSPIALSPSISIKRPSPNPDTKDAIATETMEIKSATTSADAYAAPSDEGQMQPVSPWQQWRHYWTSREGWIGDYVRFLPYFW
jgi:hypothetical protein